MQNSKRKLRLAQKRKKNRNIKLIILLVSIILFFSLFVFLLTRDWISIKEIKINGNETVSSKSIESVAFNRMSRLRAYTLYAGTILTYDKSDIIESLKYEYPQLKYININSRDIKTLNITVKEREPIALWCINQEIECYLMDDTGYIYDEVMDLKSYSNLVIYKSETLNLTLRNTLLPSAFLQINDFLNTIKDFGIQVTQVEINEEDNEFFVYSSGHPVLRIRLNGDLTQVASYIEATLNAPDYLNYANSVEKVEYIDLRFGNRIFYK